jgi:transcription antitermination factor NusG
MITSLPQQLAPVVNHANLDDVASCKPFLSWFAVYTMPQSEKSVRRMLDIRQIESFLPTFESQRVWKNRQRVRIEYPLFPSYLFVHINAHQRGIVLSAPGALHIIGSGHVPLAIPDREIEFLRSDFCKKRVEPYSELVIGTSVRVKAGPMRGVSGTLVQKKNSLRFVLTIAMINQSAAVEVQADELEPFRN